MNARQTLAAVMRMQLARIFPVHGPAHAKEVSKVTELCAEVRTNAGS